MNERLPSQPEESLSDRDLDWMADRAWRRAARSWQEAREYQRQHGVDLGRDSTIARMLMEEAESAEATWRRLADEQKRRAPHYEGRESPGASEHHPA
jgi:hypothetical protein